MGQQDSSDDVLHQSGAKGVPVAKGRTSFAQASKKIGFEPRLSRTSEQRYSAVVRKVADAFEGQVREFPDICATDRELFGCVEQLHAMLQLRVDALLAKNLAVPLPQKQRADHDGQNVVVTLDVQVPFETECVLLQIDPNLAQRIDAVSQDRPGFFIAAAERWLTEEDEVASASASARSLLFAPSSEPRHALA